MMGRKALEAAQILVDELGLVGQITPEQFRKEREEVGDQDDRL
jgi:pseudouridine-5'-monophosphatase